MADPAPAKRTPPATQVRDLLEEMQTVLTEMQTQQQRLVESETVLADVRDTIREAVQVMGERVKAQTTQPVVAPHASSERGVSVWLFTGLCGVVALLALSMLWRPVYPRYDGLGRGLDAVLTQHYSTLPKPVQEAVTRSYADQGLQGPAQRKGTGK